MHRNEYDPPLTFRKKITFISIFVVEMIVIQSVAVAIGRNGSMVGVMLWAILAALVIILCTIIPMSVSMERTCATSIFNGFILLVGSIVAPVLTGISHYNIVFYSNNVGGISVEQALFYPTVNAFQFLDGVYLPQYVGQYYNQADDTVYLITPLVSQESNFKSIIYAWGVSTQDPNNFNQEFTKNGERVDPIQVSHFKKAVDNFVADHPELQLAAKDLPLLKTSPGNLIELLAQFKMLRILGYILFLGCLTFFVVMNITIFWGRSILKFAVNPPVLKKMKDKYMKKERVLMTTFAPPPPELSHADRPIGAVNPDESQKDSTQQESTSTDEPDQDDESVEIFGEM